MLTEDEPDELPEKVELMSKKWLTKDLINRYSIFNGSNILAKIDHKIILYFKYLKIF